MEAVDETFPSPYVHVDGLSYTAPYLQQVEMTSNCIMTHHLTAPASHPKTIMIAPPPTG